MHLMTHNPTKVNLLQLHLILDVCSDNRNIAILYMAYGCHDNTNSRKPQGE